MSSLPPFLSSPLSSSSPAFLLFLFVIVAVLLIQINRRTGSSPAAPGPPPARGSIPCLPWLPVAGSLPWLGGGRPGSQAKEVLLQKGRDFAGRPTMVREDSLLNLLDALLKGQMDGGRGQRSSGAKDEGITDDHVLMTAAEAFGAGVETTSTTLLWILAYLLHHPEDRVQKELDDCVGSERPVCLSDRSRLPYLDCVINEGMRIRPVSPILIPHIAMTHSSIGGHSVSQGTRVLVNMWSIHHDTEHWDKPDIFNPDRFLNDQGQRVIPPCFLPFGAGPRVCVGESLARLELFMFLSSLLQRLSFRLPDGAPPPNLQGRLGVVLQPLPYEVVVTPRAGWKNSV
uniref:Cytochrome P450, family 17, subfamily A, polypeptide 2 n=1 Tax=Echeneis naucrates TaxID=173247 RepID=A0A665U3A7_ECHNA